jgi:hypothetical protein
MENGNWAYEKQPDLLMEIPLPDRSPATISQAEVSTAEKTLGVWSTVDGDDKGHLLNNITGRFMKWTSKMTNGHLPARLSWIVYKFKLWPGIRYGLATLAMRLSLAQATLQKKNFCNLPFMGVNRNMKRESWTLH